MSNRAPTYQDPALHFDALRLVALREGGRTEETIAIENERKFLSAHLCMYTQPHAALCYWSKLTAHSQPALRSGLMTPAFGVLFYVFGG